MSKKSITKRWLINNVGVMAIILVVVILTGSFAVRNYYYSSVMQLLTSQMNGISGSLSRYSSRGGSLTDEITSLVESFEARNSMELMAINSRGKVALTSSGFSPDENLIMPDYDSAKESPDDTGYFTGVINGESVMAMTYIIADSKSDYEALRVIVSLERTDAQIFRFIGIICLLCAGVLALVLLSGVYFIKSIVIPVRKIGDITVKFAKGDFSVRIKKKHDDEIGELCEAINRMADELSATENMKNEFISGVSHELRTPLTAIKGWGETLADVDDPEIIKKGMRVINSETERLAKMVEELLDFSRLQSGRFRLNKENMDPLAELEEAVMIYTQKAARENIELRFDEPEYLPIIFGDRDRIRQVFINIIDNAVKYSKESGGVIEVKAWQSGGKVLISVSDNGVGISANDLPNVKKKFYKANHTRRGSGIGLGVADEIVSRHGGLLEIDSIEGVGTTVTISFPAADKKRTAKERKS